MNFLTPIMLVGAIAAGIPIAIHLFFRSRYRTVPWAAMKFLLTSVEQTSRRLKFQEMLLLLLRICVLIMLAIAFARPISSVVRGAGRGDAVDAVFVFDVSFSMGANDGAKTRFQRAQEEAIKIIEELPAHSTVQVIACAGTTHTPAGPRSPANLDLAKALIQDLAITHLATDLQVGVAKAQEVLTHGQASNKELYIFSDMQKLGFDQQSGELKATLNKIKEKTLIHFVRCGTRVPKNVAIVGIVPQTGMPRPGDRVGFAVLVRNTSTEAVENLTASLAVDGNEKNRETTSIPKLPPGETRAVTLSCLLEKAGLRVLTAKVGPDDLAGDNRFDQVVLVRDQVNILVVDGGHNERDPDKSSSYFLMHAFLPQVKDTDRASFYLQPRVVSARLATPLHLNKQDMVVLANVSLQGKGARGEVLSESFVEALDPFVRKGQSLVIFGGENVQPDAYNKLLGKKHGLLPMPLKPVVKAPEKEPFLVNRGSFNLPAFATFKNDKLYEDFAKVIVWQTLELDENAAATGDIESLRYSVYQDEWSTLPDFGTLQPVAEGKLPKGLFDLGPRTQSKEFGFVFEGTLVVPENGKYTFFLDAADGARLTISGEEVVKYDGVHELGSEQKATVELTKGKQPIKLEYFHRASRPGLAVAWAGPAFARRPLSAGEESPVNVILRLNTGLPLVANKKVDAGEVIFVATAPESDIFYAKSLEKTWTTWPIHPTFIPFTHVMINHLMHGQTQTYNLVAGQTLSWFPSEKLDSTYNLVHPETKTDEKNPDDTRKIERLKPPEKIGKRVVVTADNLPHAGVYYMTAMTRGSESVETSVSAAELVKTGTPIAVVPDLRESEDLSAYNADDINQRLGFEPIHITAGGGEAAVSTGAERLNREWTVWVLLAVLFLALGEVVLAWWCGRAW